CLVFSSKVFSFVFCIFFFSSRRRHTRFSRDWSSDVCSSDLCYFRRDNDKFSTGSNHYFYILNKKGKVVSEIEVPEELQTFYYDRSEERRVGKSVDLGGRRIMKEKKIIAECDTQR